ncbi:thioredoxin family protein [Aquimarina sp. ERC-38]|uniref:thioredoxin family protein n=1 Tax=Aquimarina sp. ERC-38 TaxID=2949996 RepID=UPI002247FBAF|nr:thioredoxin family protein [Aquimarina sp. ERC-38]UZO81617.1 thioredoxin family protein [Aquimarina sp. ERC-38]
MQTSTLSSLIEETINKAYTYQEYRTLTHQLAEEGKTTGPDQSENLVQFSQLNDKRMKRLDKTIKIDSEAAEKLNAVQKKIIWLVITEAWCGDASQSMPVLKKLADTNPNFEMKVILRDENEELMNNFLTNGGKSIPKVIFYEVDTKTVLHDWGPRPTEATNMVKAYKEEHGKLTPEFKQDLQQWYNKNKGKAITEDIVKLLT